MPSTNAIRSFAEKVRVANITKSPTISLTVQDARNLNYEIEQILALLVELQSKTTNPSDLTIEIQGGKF